MAKQTINKGSVPNDNTGDTLRDGASKINANFNEVYTSLGDGTTITFDASSYLSSSSVFTNKTIGAANNNLIINLNDLSDVSANTAYSFRQRFEYWPESSQWVSVENTLANLNDIKTSGVGYVPANNQVLTWSSDLGNWIPANSAGGSTVSSLNDVTDVMTSGTMSGVNHNPTDGQVLGWNSTMNHWMPITISGANTSNADYVTLTGTQTLTNKTINVANNSLTLGAISTLSNVSTATPSNGQVLTWNSTSSNWTPTNSPSYNSTNSEYDFGSNKILYSNFVAAESDLNSYSPSTYHGMVMHVHATGAAYYAHAGEWRKLLTDTSYGNPVGAGYTDPLANVAYSGTISSLTDVSTATPSAGQVLKWDASTGWTPAADNTGSGGSGIALTSLSVTQNSVGTANLVYSNTTGVFTYTPPDLTSYLTSVGALSSHTDVSTSTPSEGQVLKWVSGSWTPASDLTSSGGSGISLTDLSITKNSVGTANLVYNNTSGVFTYTPPDLSSYLTSVGTLSSHTDVSTNSPTNGQVLKWNSTASEWQPQADNAGSGGGIALTDLSVTMASAGSAALSYNESTGIFTYTPPNLSSYLTSVGALSSHTDVSATAPSNGQVLKWNSSASEWQPQADNAGSGGGISNVVEDTSPQLGGDLDTNGFNVPVQHIINIGASGSSAYTFSDPGNVWFPSTQTGGALYLRFGETYILNNNSGGGHPFRIQSVNSPGGALFNTGVTNNGAASGSIIFKVPMSARGTTLYYYCSVHSAMNGSITIV